MSLKIEFTKNGKPNILFNNSKYRESYALKSGEIIWRCLGRNCGAKIKSNSERTTSPYISSDKLIVAATPPAAETTTPRPSTTPSPTRPGSPIEALTNTATYGYPSPATLITASPAVSSPDAVSGSALPRSSSGLEAENLELRRRIDQLMAEREQSLYHSIQSDARLLQFTDQLFVANSSTIETPGGRTADCAVQCDLSSSTACQDPRYSEIRNLVTSLKTTVEVLEAELECFKAEAVKKSKTHQSDSENEGWGDSHFRHLIGLVRECVSPSTRVGGNFRPRAKLLTVTDSSIPPPGSCYVLFAGTNDVAGDESYTIFEHLERQLTTRLSSSAVIVSTVPHRHDLSMDHAELSVRYKGIEVLNFNEIGRRWFTQHGMHLRLPGKWLLAELLLGCLDRFGLLPTIRPPTSPAHAASSCAASSTPSSSLHVQDRQKLSSEALSPTAVQPVEPVIVGYTTSRPVPLLKTPGPASSRLALVSPPAGAMTRPGNKTFDEAVSSCLPAISSPVPSVKIDYVFLWAARPANEQN
ncbi:hypothetical protein J6590_075010 [Homalodisca vitripennis]|nr:hypothetical protein J6590_075010 [Homalodisca vitripennis]